MKKILTIAMAAALTLAAAGQASAAALETSGQYRGRYWYLSNYDYSALPHDSSQDFWDQRLRLNMSWQVSEGVKVNARADVLENTWDFTAGTNDKSEIDFDHANIQFNWGPTQIAVGKMDVTWGLGTYAAADNRYRLRIGTKVQGIGIGFALDNITETGSSSLNGDRIALSLGAVIPIGTHTLGVLGLVDMNDTTTNVEKRFYAFVPYFKGAFGPVKLNAEGAIGFGSNDTKGGASVDTSTLFGYVGAFMPAGPVSVGVEMAYAQGNDPNTAEIEGAVGQDYNGPFSSFILYNQFDLDGWVSQYKFVDGVTAGDIGVNNSLALKASGTYNMTKQLSFMGAVVYAMADQTKAGQDDSMGIEFDALAKYMITENLTVQAGFGYLVAGDYFGVNTEDPWVLTTHAVVSF